MIQQRPCSLRQKSPLRKPWHVDYLIMRRLVHDIVVHRGYARGRLLDVGCGNRPYAPLLRHVREYIGIDINHQTGTPDIASLAYALPFASESFDTVFSTQTLEHIEVPDQVVGEMARVLAPGGYLILTVPQTWRLHEKPYDFYRYTRYGLLYLLEHHGLRVEMIVPQGGVWLTVGQTINNAIHNRLRAHLPIYLIYLVYLANNAVFGWLDDLWRDDDETLNYLVVAQKPI